MLCPICKKSVSETSLKPDAGGRNYFPFCSERCKLIDLDRWLGGKYQIPVKSDDSEDEPDVPRRAPPYENPDET